MIPVFKCGKCGKNTQMYPTFEYVMQEVEEKIPVEVKEIVDGNLQVRMDYQIQKRLVQKTRPQRRQNVFTGKIEVIDVPVTITKIPKTVQIQLKLGEETITKALCPRCYEKFKEQAEKFWQELERLRS